MRKSFDVLLLFVLVVARVRIDTIADLGLPQRHEDVRRLVGAWWPAASLDLLADWLSDPITLMLISVAFGLLLVYLLVDMLPEAIGRPSDTTVYHLKLSLIYALIAVLVGGKTLLYLNLRHITDPAAYTHDGGVIQTEITIDYFLQGKSPYIEDYLHTPMASWGIEYRTALYHYPYLPWTFIFSSPFYLLSHALLGWYDQRMVYLSLFALTLVMAQSLAPNRPYKLLIVMLMGLNPILASDVLFGQNDSFILFWLVLAVWLTRQRHDLLANVALGCACASKPTAWFIAPFWALYLLRHDWGDALIPPRSRWLQLGQALLRQTWPLLAVMGVVIGPWAIWSPDALIDDVWRWSSGSATTPYQIRGWGFSNFVLAFQLVPDRLAFWPFWVTEILIATPMLWLALRRQLRHNTLGYVLMSYVGLLFPFFYSSRFLNENYLGYLTACLILAYLIETEP